MNRKHRKKSKIILAAALLLTAAAALVGVLAPELTAPAQRALGAAAVPFYTAADFLSDRVEGLLSYADDHRALQQRVAELEAQVAQLEGENQTARAALKENERLREVLKLRQRNTDFAFAAAHVIARSDSVWRSELTLDAGTANGLGEGMCVVTGQGYLVGVVVEAAQHTAVVRTLLDPETAIGARGELSGDAGVLKSDLDHLAQGTCYLSYLGSDASLSPGDRILTSGLGGNYPPGLVMGRVVETGLAPSGMERYALVEPAVAVDEVKQVFVITAFDVTQ